MSFSLNTGTKLPSTDPRDVMEVVLETLAAAALVVNVVNKIKVGDGEKGT